MYFLGIDIGSTTSKCVILDENKNIISKALIKAGAGTKGSSLVLEEIFNQTKLTRNDITTFVGTGYGRKLLDDVDFDVSELTCHAKGAYYLFPNVKTIIDIGGQDAKVLSLDNKGKMLNFLMNDKCAAGTGRFLDVMSSILFIDINQLSDMALEAINPCSISSTCTVFAESEVISQLAKGVKTNDLVAGICNSVGKRVSVLAKRIGINQDVCMTGGVAINRGVRDAISKELDCPIYYSELSQYAGAIGAAIYGLEKEFK